MSFSMNTGLKTLKSTALLILFSSFASVALASQVVFTKTIDATSYSSESHPFDENKIRNMGNKVGYIKDGTHIEFDEFVIPQDNFPTEITVTYSSGGAGGWVEFVAEEYGSDRTLGISLGEFYLPATGGWNQFETTSFVIPFNSEFNYLKAGTAVPLRLEFKNPDASGFLFDVVSFKVDNQSQTSGFSYNDTISAPFFSSESNPENDNLIRDMGHKVGYIKDGTSISFDHFSIPDTVSDNIPTSVTITYASNGAGGSVEFVADNYGSDRTLGISLGEFYLPPTGGWDQFETVTFDIPFDFEFNYLGGDAPLHLLFKNPNTGSFLFDIVSFEINN